MKFRQSQWSVKCRLRVGSWCVLVDYVKDNYYARCFMILAIIGKEKDTSIFLDQNSDKVNGA